MQNYGRKRFLKLVGDATRDETNQRFKKPKVGVAGKHFVKYKWSSACLLFLFAAISQESEPIVLACLDSLFSMAKDVADIDLTEFIED